MGGNSACLRIANFTSSKKETTDVDLFMIPTTKTEKPSKLSEYEIALLRIQGRSFANPE